MITLKGVTKSFQSGQTKTEVLKGIDLEIKEGDTIVIRGPSGSGKSTLLNIIGLLDAPTQGEVSIHGKPVAYGDFDKLAAMRSTFISFIFQSFNLNPVLTAKENIMIPFMIRRDISRSASEERVHDWLQKVDLFEHRDKKPDQLSGGQKQRVAIARAMATQPQLIIADEPTANLDAVTARTIIDLMKALSKKQGTAFICATHDPAWDYFAETHLRLVDGRIQNP